VEFFVFMVVNTANWAPESISSTNFTANTGSSVNISLTGGAAIGLLLGITHAANLTVPTGGYTTNFAPESINSTNWTSE
jgi:hypothetical protein